MWKKTEVAVRWIELKVIILLAFNNDKYGSDFLAMAKLAIQTQTINFFNKLSIEIYTMSVSEMGPIDLISMFTRTVVTSPWVS